MDTTLINELCRFPHIFKQQKLGILRLLRL